MRKFGYFSMLCLCMLTMVCLPLNLSAGTLNGQEVDDAAAPTVTNCWVSHTPAGVPTTHVPESDGSANGTYWLNASGIAPSLVVKFTAKFLQGGTNVKKNVTQFANVSGTITTPFAFPFGFGNSHHGSALLVVKDSNNKCTFPFTVGDSAFESPDTKAVGTALVDSTVNVSGIDGIISKVTVSISLDHTWDGDLDISLISPGGIVVDLTSDNGGSGDDYGNSSFARTIFDDGAPTSIVTATPPFTGVFQSEQSLAAFNGLSGAGANGIWTLRVADDVTFADGGYLRGWAIVIRD